MWYIHTVNVIQPYKGMILYPYYTIDEPEDIMVSEVKGESESHSVVSDSL